MASNGVTLTELITRVRQRADMVGSSFVSDDEIMGYLNVAVSVMHDMLVIAYESMYVSKTADITMPLSEAVQKTGVPFVDTDIGGDTITGIAPDFYKVLGVDFTTSSLTFRVKPFEFSERSAYSNPFYTNTALPQLFYSVQGGFLKFIPEKTVNGTCNMWYVPEAEQFSTGTDTVMSVEPQLQVGWEEYLVIDAAIKCLTKEESDVKVHLVERERLSLRLTTCMQNRDAGESRRITESSTGTMQSNFINWL